jgi:hypothetical protein
MMDEILFRLVIVCMITWVFNRLGIRPRVEGGYKEVRTKHPLIQALYIGYALACFIGGTGIVVSVVCWILFASYI